MLEVTVVSSEATHNLIKHQVSWRTLTNEITLYGMVITVKQIYTGGKYLSIFGDDLIYVLEPQ